MEPVGKFNNQDANIGAEGDHEAEEIIFGFGEISIEVFHIFSDIAEFCHAINKESDSFAKFGFYIF